MANKKQTSAKVASNPGNLHIFTSSSALKHSAALSYSQYRPGIFLYLWLDFYFHV